jgi:hypothetical protein
MPKPSKWSLPFKFSDQSYVYISHLSHACYMLPSLILFDLIALIIFGEEYRL